MSQTINQLKSINVISVIFLIAVSYLFISFFAAYPYRLFPSDDLVKFLGDSQERLGYSPVFAYVLDLCKSLTSLFSDDIKQSLLIFGTLTNSATLIFVGMITYSLTGKRSLVVAAMLLYATAGWPTNYLFIASYTLQATTLNALIYLLIIKAYQAAPRLSGQYNFQKTYFPAFILKIPQAAGYFFLAGIAAGWLFLSTPSASVEILIHLIIIPFLFRRFPFLIVCYTLPIIIMTLFSGPEYWTALQNHLTQNLNTGHYAEAQSKFGYIPQAPFFSFFRMSFVYAPILTAAFYAALIFSILNIFRKDVHYLSNRISVILFASVIFHGLVIDFLPFTKLGRTHFPIYFLLIIAVVVSWHHFRNRNSGNNRLKYIGVVVFFGMIANNLIFSSQIIRHKQAVGNFIDRYPSKIELFFAKNDHHAEYIAKYLSNKITLVETINEISNIDQIKNREFSANEYKLGVKGLIIGPQGELSGRSILKRSLINDFHLDKNKFRKPTDTIEIKLPYYAYFPSFVFEEEISQALYFEGKLPNYRDAEKQVSIWIL